MATDQSSTRPLPQDVDTERAILGAILVNNDLLNQVGDKLESRDFFLEQHQHIYSQMMVLSLNNKAIDDLTLKNVLDTLKLPEPVSRTYLVSLTDGVPRLDNVIHYVDIIKEKSVLRKLIQASHQILTKCHAQEDNVFDIMKSAEDRIFDISQSFIKKNYMPLSEALQSAYLHLDKLYQEKSNITGISTGYKQLDLYTCGLQRGELIILAARPSMGKTSLALNMALNAALGGNRTVLVFSLEMSARQLAMRLISSDANIDGQKIRSGYFNRDDWEHIAHTVNKLNHAKLFIDETASLSILELQTKARRLKKEAGLDLVVIDYMQLMMPDRRYENRNQEIATISRSLKALAKELDVPVLALSQLSRAPESRKGDHRPMLADLRESGSIEQDADMVIFIFREEVYVHDPALQGKAEIIIAKQRNGPLHTVDMVFLKERSQFVEASFERLSANET